MGRQIWTHWLIVALGASLFLSSSKTGATYSVLVHDRTTGHFGGAAVSCVGDFDLSHIFGYVPSSAPNPGGFAFFAQALYAKENHARVLAWGAQGQTPPQILDSLTQAEFDPLAPERQYHLLSAAGEQLTWTGAQTLPYAGSRSGAWGPWSFTAAGNILSSEQVLENIAKSFEGSVEPLGLQLLVALEAGALNGEGDTRCGQLPGDSAFLTVVAADGTVQLSHSVVNTQPQNPLTLMRESLALETWPQSGDTTEQDTATASYGRNGGCQLTPASPRQSWPFLLLVGATWLLRRQELLCRATGTP